MNPVMHIIVILVVIILLASFFSDALLHNIIDLEKLLEGYIEGFNRLGNIFQHNPLRDLVNMISTGEVNGEEITFFNLDEVIKALADSLVSVFDNGFSAIDLFISFDDYIVPLEVNQSAYDFQLSEGW